MKKLTKLFTIIALMIAINSCKKNELSNTDIIVPYDPGTTITTAVAGNVTNQNGDALNGVEITIGTSTVITDVNGDFIIPSATLAQKAGLIKATKAGYFAGSRTITPKEKVVNNVVIQLVKKTESGNFANASGGTITVATGGSIVFPANAVVTKTGAAYSGSVKVAAYFLNPTSANCYKEMPGDLRGINASNNEQILTSYGMMAVELQGSNGEALQMASGKTAELTFPVDASIQSNAPATIPLWYFDETKAMWVEQGTAIKVGNNYVGTVSHFTWWNCDWGGGPLTLTAKFVDQNGNPLDNYHVYYITSNGLGGGGGHGWTASDGSLTGRIPANEQIIVKVKNKNSCSSGNTTIDSSVVGPFTQNTDLGTITVNTIAQSQVNVTIKGTVVDCNNNPVTNGYANIHFNNHVYYTYLNNGSFSKTITYCTTVPTGVATIDVFDLTTLKQNTAPASINVTGVGTFNVGQVAVCGIQALVKYSFSLVDQNGNAVKNGYTLFNNSIKRNFSTATNLIDTIPANLIMSRKIYVNTICGQVLVDTALVGPFTTDFNAGVINVTVPQSNIFTISGTVQDCNNANVAYGKAIITVDGKTYTSTISNGIFNQQITRCNNNAVTANIIVRDSINNEQNSTPITLSVSNANVNIGTVQACGISVSAYLNYTVGNIIYNADSLSSYRRSNLTYITGMAVNPYSNFNANFSGVSVGTFDLNLTHSDATMTQYTSTQGTTVTITEYGNVGGYIAGTFSGNLTTSITSPTTPISGSFRIKRVQ